MSSSDAEAELSRFRQQWQEEVSSRARAGSSTKQLQPQPAPPPTAAAPGPGPSSRTKPKATKAPAFASSRRISGGRAPADEDSAEEGEDGAEEKRGRRESAGATVATGAGARRPEVPVADVPVSALEHYEKAVEKETQGSLGDSLKLYRQAFRMDERVDRHYKEKHFPRSAQPPPPHGTGTAKGKQASTAEVIPAPPTGPNTAHHSLTADPTTTNRNNKKNNDNNDSNNNKPVGVADLIASFAGLRILPVSATSLSDSPSDDDVVKNPNTDQQPAEDAFSPLATIPSEILLHIVRDLALADLASLARLALVCKALCHLVCSEQSIYRAVCARVFTNQVYNWAVTVTGHPLSSHHHTLGTSPPPPSADTDPYQPSAGFEEIADGGEVDDDDAAAAAAAERTPPPLETAVRQYDAGSWRAMLRLRPRVRYNGIYISTCNYLRPGATSASAVAWNSPVHIVTYYRFLRFYPDGTALSLLTTHEPADVVHAFAKPALPQPQPLPQSTPQQSALQQSALSSQQQPARPAKPAKHPHAKQELAPPPPPALGWAKYVSAGRWRVSPDGRVDVETITPGMERYLFRQQLRIARAGRRGAAKLVWEGFWSWNRLTEDLAEFQGRNDKPYFFSRVGAVEREMGLA